MSYLNSLNPLLSLRCLRLIAVMGVGVLTATGCQTMPNTTAISNPSTVVANKANSAANLVQNLTLVKENHHVMTIGSGKYTATYVLDSYIMPFQQPYYILVRQQNGKPFSKHAAIVVALDYIQPRGCTAPLQRLEQLDKQNADGSAYLLAVAC